VHVSLCFAVVLILSMPATTCFQQLQGSFLKVGDTEHVPAERQRLKGSQTSTQAGDLAPWMTESELHLFRETLTKAEAYIEYGIGGSTVFAAGFENLKCMKSFESADEWIQKVSQNPVLSAALKAGRLELTHRDLGPVKMYGYPLYENKEKFRRFSDPPVGTCADHVRRVVLVDGRFRVACFLKMLACMNPEQAAMTQLLMHDYIPERAYYRAVEEFADIIEKRDKLALFEMKFDVNRTALEEAILRSELDPK